MKYDIAQQNALSREGAVGSDEGGETHVHAHVPILEPIVQTKARPFTSSTISRCKDARQLLNLAFDHEGGPGLGGRKGRHALASGLAERMLEQANTEQSSLKSQLKAIEPILSPHLHQRTSNRSRLRARQDKFLQSGEGRRPATSAGFAQGLTPSGMVGVGSLSLDWPEDGAPKTATAARKFPQFVASDHNTHQVGSDDNYWMGRAGLTTSEHDICGTHFGSSMPEKMEHFSNPPQSSTMPRIRPATTSSMLPSLHAASMGSGQLGDRKPMDSGITLPPQIQMRVTISRGAGGPTSSWPPSPLVSQRRAGKGRGV
jgi:hypothetical protein